ncbi:hypothetical protein HK099_003729 [Clydaea vesicula]|uniref:SANTA domain-containing protein n=1 Tax=Clydaea vesicula TaxID=447962 RepID=A0AAD5U368_9FUNG|nr:hypothetical protein HK099_003729 [Clydaea vesicula]
MNNREKDKTLVDWFLIKRQVKPDQIKPISDYPVKFWLVVCGQQSDGVLWNSSLISTRIDNFTLLTKSNSRYILKGTFNKEKTEKHGFSPEFAQLFCNGFPVNWKEELRKEILIMEGLSDTYDLSKVNTFEKLQTSDSKNQFLSVNKMDVENSTLVRNALTLIVETTRPEFQYTEGLGKVDSSSEAEECELATTPIKIKQKENLLQSLNRRKTKVLDKKKSKDPHRLIEKLESFQNSKIESLQNNLENEVETFETLVTKTFFPILSPKKDK